MDPQSPRSGTEFRTGRWAARAKRFLLIGLGGYHLGKQSDPGESIRIIRTGIDEGINFLDNCWDYNGGEAKFEWAKPCAMVIAKKPS